MSKGQIIASQLASSVNNPAPHPPSQATTAGCGEAARAEMLDRLWQQHRVASLTLAEVRENYFKRIKTDKHLRALIRKGKVQLRTFTMFESRLDEPRVTLEDLADLLVRRAMHSTHATKGTPPQPSQEPAADQAA